MEIITAEQLSFRYPEAERESLHGLSFKINEGDFVVLCGPSGGGKTTLLRQLKREITPVGDRSGVLMYKGLPLGDLPAERSAAEIGMVFQNPEAQIVMDTVWHELCFAMENLGLSQQTMRSRLAEIAGLFGLEPLLYQPLHTLSGGQKQLVNLASVLLLQPEVLLLDEPTAQLDPVAAREFMDTLRRLNEEMAMTVIISEHRLEEVLPLADRVLLLENGVLRLDGTPREFVQYAGHSGQELTAGYLPAAPALFLALAPEPLAAPPAEIPLTLREGKSWLGRAYHEAGGVGSSTSGVGNRPSAGATLALPEADAPPLLSARELSFRYEKDAPEVLRKLNVTLRQGELLAVMGGNGAGKSSLLYALGGLVKPQRGKVTLAKGVKSGYLAQNPLLYFSHDTVIEELQQMAAYAGMSESESGWEIARLSSLFRLGEVLGSHPLDISGGQQQLLALGIVLLQKPGVLLLDEPTKGLDPAAKDALAAVLKHLRAEGIGILMVTHDVEFAARHATRCAMLFDGGITAEGAPAPFFGANYFYTTAVNRMMRELLPDALTVEDVRRQWPNTDIRC
ncbi:energy-coupling factor transport system ATP-binding protein [Paenibacillus sp. NFR01]|nr:energy-coupling factor transport system ATP-binding protein [Paenibacillus sp. NFR01]